jgi:hypothetical protein
MAIPDVPLPGRMRHLPEDPRGYPIPWTVYRDGEGRPHFTISDEALRQRTILEDRCSICGQNNTRGRCFVGGPLCAFHDHGAYIDPPMHRECATYALQVCPFLAAPHYGRRIEDRTLDRGKAPGELVAVDAQVRPGRPELFVLVMAVGQSLIRRGGLVRYVKPTQPYRLVEYWREGRRLSEAEGGTLAAKALVEGDVQ